MTECARQLVRNQSLTPHGSHFRLRSAIAKMHGKSVDDETVNKLMKAADTNGDDVIDLEEFKKIMRAEVK